MKMKGVNELERCLQKALEDVKITDIHTHLFSECFGGLFLYGIDGLLTYHYLIDEAFRHLDIPYDAFIDMNMEQKAELVWKTLFVENTPVSEAARSVITIFEKLGLDVNHKDLNYYRRYFASVGPMDAYIDQVFEIAGLKDVVMTNDPLNDEERQIWEQWYVRDERFKSSMRVDALLNTWDMASAKLKELGYRVNSDLSGEAAGEVRRFLHEWLERMDALYCAASLPPDFKLCDGSVRSRIIEECILPECKGRNIPMGLMIGVRRNVNPLLDVAGDSLGRADIKAVEYLAAKYPGNKFLVTVLSLESQHELIVAAKKFRNVMPFGCWWYVNNPSMIENITTMRFELLGTSFIPQHSDCRIFEQLISKWLHSKAVLKKVMVNQYAKLLESGYEITEEQIYRDVHKLMGQNFRDFCGMKLKAGYEDRYYHTDHLY